MKREGSEEERRTKGPIEIDSCMLKMTKSNNWREAACEYMFANQTIPKISVAFQGLFISFRY